MIYSILGSKFTVCTYRQGQEVDGEVLRSLVQLSLLLYAASEGKYPFLLNTYSKMLKHWGP